MSRSGTAQARSAYLAPLTGLRFLAAMHVVFLHLAADGHLGNLPRSVQRIVDGADIAVDFFFILSGFILSYSYLAADGRSLAGGRTAFWVARFARIYPVYVLGLLIAIPFLPTVFSNLSPVEALATLVTVPALLQGWSPDLVTLWNPPAWSLSTEAFFYLLFPGLLPLFARLRGRVLAAILWLGYGLGLLAPLAFVLARITGEAAGWWERAIIFGPAFHLPEFVLGVTLGLAFVRYQHHPLASRRSVRLTALTLAPLAGAAYLLAAWSADSLPRAMTGNGLFAPVFALLIVSLASNSGGPGRILSTRPMVLLGEASYALYLLHIPLFWWIDREASLLPDGGSWLFSQRWFAPGAIGLAVGISLAVFVFIERPMRHALRQLLLRPASVAWAAQPQLNRP